MIDTTSDARTWFVFRRVVCTDKQQQGQTAYNELSNYAAGVAPIVLAILRAYDCPPQPPFPRQHTEMRDSERFGGQESSLRPIQSSQIYLASSPKEKNKV